jgi:Rieske 2Fe-2S family protein
MENFHECYHCLPAHPEYCSAMTAVVNMIARVPTKQEAVAWNEHVTRWLREEADANFPVTSQLFQGEQGAQFRVSREPIGGGRKTQSADGAPIAPLMGQVSRFDGSVAYFDLWPLIVFTMLNDHAVLFQFLPAGPESTDVIITWLVDGSAAQSEVDVERMVWLWDVTTLQDKKIIENNAAGIRSLAYTPGPYSTVESSAMNLVNDYLRGMAAHCDGNPD